MAQVHTCVILSVVLLPARPRLIPPLTPLHTHTHPVPVPCSTYRPSHPDTVKAHEAKKAQAAPDAQAGRKKTET